MRAVGNKFIKVLAVASLIAVVAVPVNAELKAVSSVNPTNGFPVWYQDTNSVALDLCLDPNDALCLQPMPIPDPNQAVSFPANFPEEAFWWTGDATIPLASGGQAMLVLAMEAAFANGPPEVGAQISFGRIRVNVDTPVTGIYTITHPYGVMVVNVTDIVQGIKNEGRDIGATGPQFVGILDPAQNDTETVDTPDMFRFGPYLRWSDPDFPVVDPVTGKRYMGNPNIAHAVTGSPFGTNFFRVDGPAGSNIGGEGIDFVETELFNVSGKIVGLGVTPFPSASVTTKVGTPADIPVTISNITGAPIAFGVNPANTTPITFSGANAADFLIVPDTDTCSGQTVPVPDPLATPAVSGTCSFQVRFNPAATTVAARNAVLTITPDDTASAPPVSVTLSGTAQYAVTAATSTTITATGSRTPGSLSPTGTQLVNAGGELAFTVTPEAGYFPRVTLDGVLQSVGNGTFSISGLGADREVNVKFIRNGDLIEDGVISMNDALRSLRIAFGIGPATDDEITAADVGPLVASKPKADGTIDVSDVLVILRRAVGLDPAW